MPNGVQEYIEKNGKSKVVFFIITEDKLQKLNLDIINFGLNNGYYIIYVTTLCPCSTVRDKLGLSESQLKNIMFIDLVMSIAGLGGARCGNCIFSSPLSLTTLNIIIKETLNKLPKDTKKMFLFDSINTLLLYNDANTVTRFMQVLVTQLRIFGVKTVICILKDAETQKFEKQISSFCDKAVKI